MAVKTFKDFGEVVVVADGDYIVGYKADGSTELRVKKSVLTSQIVGMVIQPVATFAALPATPTGLYLVLADETKAGAPTFYLFNGSDRFWGAWVKDN
jgi:hypothetical protein